jgi:hypothetical protein
MADPTPAPAPAHPALAALLEALAQFAESPQVQALLMALLAKLIGAQPTVTRVVDCSFDDPAPAPTDPITQALAGLDTAVQAYQAAVAQQTTDQAALAAAQQVVANDQATASSDAQAVTAAQQTALAALATLQTALSA